MGIRTERKRITKEPDVRRRELMDAAVRVFRDKGVSRSTVADITRTAGVAKGTFYLYFTSKEHLLGALKERLVGEIRQTATDLYSRVGKDDWEALVDATVESYVDFFIERQEMIHVIVQEGVDPETTALFADVEAQEEEMFATAIRLGMDDGVFHVSDPEMTGRLLHSACVGSLKNAILYRGGIDRDRYIAAGREMARKVLAPARP